MSSGNAFERLYKVQATANKLVLDGKRDPDEVADILQQYVIDRSTKEPTKKFALLVDLGIIVVPDDYKYATALGMFFARNRKKFCGVDNKITDANFGNPSRMLRPGDRLHVRAWKQVVSGATRSIERMTFLKYQLGNVFTGAQGLACVFEQKRNQLPKGVRYASFDEADRLLQDADSYRRVPCVHASMDGDFYFDLGFLENHWNEDFAFLSFCDA